MPEWRSIETAPKDGSIVWVKRVYEGRVVKEGWTAIALFSGNRPHGVEWLPFALFTAFWPLWWLFVVGGAIKRSIRNA